MIRTAKISDVRQIHNMLAIYSQRGILLGRSLSDLYDQIRDFFVATDMDENSVQGMCALHICWEEIAEIRSFAVKEDCQGLGIGMQLLDACIDEARQLGIKKLFVLTYVPGFFKKTGFYSVDKSVLPLKVWSDCVNCVKFPDCDEEALMLEI